MLAKLAVRTAALLALVGLCLGPALAAVVTAAPGPAPAPASVGPVPTPGPTVSSDPNLASQLAVSLEETGHAALVPSLLALPLAPVERFLEVNEAPTSTEAEVYAADSAAFAIAPAFNWGSLLGAVVGGCVTGAIVGGLIGAAAAGIGALPGAGIGCVAGAAAGGLGDYLGQNAVHETNEESFAVADAEVANELRLVLGEANAVESILPATSYFWGRLADVAAESQIGNSSFNASLDLNQSTVSAQLGTITNSVLAELDESVLLWASFAIANGACVDLYGYVGGETAAYCLPIETYVPFGVKLNSSTAALLVPNGAYEFNQASTESEGAYYCNEGAGPAPSPIALGEVYCKTSSEGDDNLSIWENTRSVVGSLQYVPDHGIEGGSAVYPYQSGTFFSLGTPFCPSASTCDNYVVALGGFSLYDPETGFDLAVQTYGTSCTYDLGGSGECFALGNATELYDQAGGLEYTAVSTGEAYWGYLRDLGYENPDSIPATYAIVPPALVLPDDLCVGNVSLYGGTGYKGACVNLNSTETFSLYLAELQAMAAFFTSATYSSVTPPANANATYWGNLNLVVYGDVYLPGVSPQNTSDHTEEFSTPSTWAVVGAQLLLFPELKGATIALNRTYEIPTLYPMEVATVLLYPTKANSGAGTPALKYDSETVDVLSLAGNGTANGTATRGEPSGDALYLTSCALYGTAQSTCDAGVYSVNVTSVILLCSANASACPIPPPPVSSANSCGNSWYGQIENILTGWLGGCGGLGNLAAEILTVIIALVVLVVVVAVVVAIVRR